jgi:hypothetical protein
VPPHVLPLLRQHTADFAGPEFFCVGRDGKRMRGNTIYQAFVRARNRVGVEMRFTIYGTRVRAGLRRPERRWRTSRNDWGMHLRNLPCATSTPLKDAT